MNFKVRALLLDRTEAEIYEEMATALGRVGKKLESLIEELHRIKIQANLCAEHERVTLHQEFESVRAHARLYYWYLIIQRESIGITNHDLLPGLYTIPTL